MTDNRNSKRYKGRQIRYGQLMTCEAEGNTLYFVLFKCLVIMFLILKLVR